MKNRTVKFIDLFAGLGGIRLGFENVFQRVGFKTKCVMTSEIKPHSVVALNENFEHDYFVGDIFKVDTKSIPDFDFLLGGFPCQPFSAAGNRQGFVDTRGTLFFEVERILRAKRPYGFILENVEGLVKHDLVNKGDEIGITLATILYKLHDDLGYEVSWKVYDSVEFGLPQSRKRIFIVGTKSHAIDLNGVQPKFKPLKSILDKGLNTIDSDFVTKLLSHFKLKDLYGKSIKDKRGGANNIHSWDIGLKGDVSREQSFMLDSLLKDRRKKEWAKVIGIDWMDGMPLTLQQINTFINCSEDQLRLMLEDLTQKGYLRFEHPKKLVKESVNGRVKSFRIYDETKPKGYNIVTGKLSFEINKILDPNKIAPTLVATDVSRLAVADGEGLRRLTIREGLRLFGYPERYVISTNEGDAFDLLGNTVAVPVVEFVAAKLAQVYSNSEVDHLTISEIPVCS